MSFWECIVILIVALIVIKPERLPEITYLLGQGVGKLIVIYHAIGQKLKKQLFPFW